MKNCSNCKWHDSGYCKCNPPGLPVVEQRRTEPSNPYWGVYPQVMPTDGPCEHYKAQH